MWIPFVWGFGVFYGASCGFFILWIVCFVVKRFTGADAATKSAAEINQMSLDALLDRNQISLSTNQKIADIAEAINDYVYDRYEDEDSEDSAQP